MSHHTVAVIRQAAAVALTYPDDRFGPRLALAGQAVSELPDSRARDELLEFVHYAQSIPVSRLGREYVDTFDLKRRHCLHLTYYSDGDTRRRGHSLARIKEIYTACGWALDSSELPDHLTVLLEFAARGDADWGRRLLTEYQPGLEMLRAGLRRQHPKYAAVLDAVCDTLPPPDRAARDAAHRLAAEGPPAEAVGLDGYRPPSILGMPTVGQSVGRDFTTSGNRR